MSVSSASWAGYCPVDKRMPTPSSNVLDSFRLTIGHRYVDGIDILYRTNAFHISSVPLLLNLPRLMPPHHLASVTTIELLWDWLGEHQTRRTIYEQAMAHPSPEPLPSTKFHDLCRITPQAFPNARHVYVALQADLQPPYVGELIDMRRLFEKAVLGPVEDMFRAMGAEHPEKEFNLAIQLRGFEGFAEHYWQQDMDDDVFERCHWALCYPDRLRGTLGYNGGEGRLTWTRDGVSFCETKAWKPLGDGAGGYWLRPGLDDRTFYFRMQCCFGSPPDDRIPRYEFWAYAW
jgi:hypothetical protein